MFFLCTYESRNHCYICSGFINSIGRTSNLVSDVSFILVSSQDRKSIKIFPIIIWFFYLVNGIEVKYLEMHSAERDILHYCECYCKAKEFDIQDTIILGGFGNNMNTDFGGS